MTGAPGIERGRTLLATSMVGVGLMAAIDEIVFHQILAWHHFYDRSTPAVGLLSDGYFHAGGWAAIVAGLFLFADLQRRRATVPRSVWAGVLVGWGGFQLYDGLIQHKVLGLHQIRYHVDLLPYDLVWNPTPPSRRCTWPATVSAGCARRSGKRAA